MNHITNVHTTPTAVHEDGAVYTASGMRISPTEARARRIAREAERWAAFAHERTRTRPATLHRKALDATAFSVLHGASSFAVPSKLAGTSEHQRALWALVREHVRRWTELVLENTGDGLAVLYGDEPLGEVQPKHLGWARPLVPFGLGLFLARVTGLDHDGYTLGCNVVFGHVGAAMCRLHDALGATQAPPERRSGTGTATGDGAAHEAVPALSGGFRDVPSETGGDGASGTLRLVVLSGVVRPETDVLRPEANPQDVVLYRCVDGTARASIAHVPRHSPTGVEWGYAGSGPADLARSILLALTDEVTAERLYQRFKTEVVARVPCAGGVLRAVDVRRWIGSQST